jgi:hypothetical protein
VGACVNVFFLQKKVDQVFGHRNRYPTNALDRSFQRKAYLSNLGANADGSRRFSPNKFSYVKSRYIAVTYEYGCDCGG